MSNRSFPATVGWPLAIVVAATALLVGTGCGSAPAPQPAASPVATTLAPEQPDTPVASAATTSEVPASAVPPSTQASTPPAAASASVPPSPHPDELLRVEQERVIRSEIAAAKAKAESLTAAANAECPDLRPGEVRHPGAVSRCARLRSEAAEAVNQYELGKKEALAAGIVIQ